jgi:hypothetical protein
MTALRPRLRWSCRRRRRTPRRNELRRPVRVAGRLETSFRLRAGSKLYNGVTVGSRQESGGQRARPHRHRRAGGNRHCDLAVRPARAPDPARGRSDRPEAAADHRRPRPVVRDLHAVRVVDPLAPRAPAGSPPQHRDRAALRGGADAARPTRGAHRRAAARRVLTASPGGRRRVLVRRDARARVRPVRRPGTRSGHRRGRESDCRDPRARPDVRVCRGRGNPDAGDRRRRPGGVHPDRVAGDARAHGVGARDRARRDRPRLPPRRPPRAAHARVHLVPAEEDRGQRYGEERARSHNGRDGPGRRQADGRGGTTGLRSRTRVSAGRRMDQLEAADARGPSRPGRARRLLDVLLHQLPADAPARSSASTRRSSRSST